MQAQVTFSQRLFEWTTKKRCQGDPWGPTRLSKATGIAVGWWGLWLGGYPKLRLGRHVHPSDLNPGKLEHWEAIVVGLPEEFTQSILALVPGAPTGIGRKECAYCGRHHAHPYLLRWCSVEHKAASYEAKLWEHDALWRDKHHLPAAIKAG